MQTLTQQLKNAANKGCINLATAEKIAAPIDAEREATITLLRKVERQVGMDLGEQINAHIADMQGVRFNAVDYHYEKPVGEQ